MDDARLFSIGLLLGALSLAACDDARIGAGDGRDDDDGAVAEYAREMMFVAAEGDVSAVLDFTTRDAGSRVHRTARGWVRPGSDWTPLFDVGWDGPGLRRAWRLVPHGPIRLRVGLDDEIEAITVRDEQGVVASLEVGDFLSEWMPFGSAQLLLREASLTLGDDSIVGWLLDARFGVTPSFGSPNGGSDAVVEAPPAAPVHALRAVLVSTDGSALVLGDTESGTAGWLWSAEGESALPHVSITSAAGDGIWAIRADGSKVVSGRIASLDEEPVALTPRSVRGIVDIDGREMEVHGVLRPPDSAE